MTNVGEVSLGTVATAGFATTLDEFGRDAAERTVELSPKAAEAINVEAEAGKHQTYDDALAYVIARGVAEIERTRAAQRKLADAKATQAAMLKFNTLIGIDPSIVSSADRLTKLMRDCGLKLPAQVQVLAATK